ncbi:MAG: type II secretion system F family protein, partial [Bdellovibrionaceae bacterium]|nr:type II secretion system F family protein [Pseudobdellovibrionaceae bacterium]
MPVFIYDAVEPNGKALSGEVKSENLHKAKLYLKSKKLEIVSLKQKLVQRKFVKSKIKEIEVLFFTRQLSFLLGAGVSLIQSIEICRETTNSVHLKSILLKMIKQLQAGKSFSQCLKQRPDIFSDFYINMISCAEKTGSFDEVLKDLANYMEKSYKTKSKIKSAMIYPVVVFFIGMLLVTGLIVFIVPRFSIMYGDKSLPILTQSLFSLSDIMRNNPLILVGIFLVLPILIY